MPRIAIYRDQVLQREYQFAARVVVVIGRAQTCDIELRDESLQVSRYHAAIVPRADGRYFARDLGSALGTKVDGNTIDRYLLSDGDGIEIGDYTLLFLSALEKAPKGGGLRIVAARPAADLSDRATTTIGLVHRARIEIDADRRELLEDLQKRRRTGVTLKTVLDDVGPQAVHLLHAERGFVRVFRDPELAAFDDVGWTGMDPTEDIEITEARFMDVLLSGRFLRDGSTLLAPILSKTGSLVGFVCANRRRAAAPFAELDGEFLIEVGRSAVAITDGSSHSAEMTGDASFEWAAQMIGHSAPMRQLRDEIRIRAGHDLPVLIVGETGAGKELVARAVHDQSPNSAGPFVPYDCGRATDSVLETVLFGYAPKSGLENSLPQGAPGLFERADHGTLLLDEIHTLTPGMQNRFLRILQDGQVLRYGAQQAQKVDVKVVTATSENVSTWINDGRFAAPLWHRLGGSQPLRVPPLRERREDVPLLAFYFLDRYASKYRGRARSISRRALQALGEYEWPGNVRELETTIVNAASRGGEILFTWHFDLPEPAAQDTGVQGQATAGTGSFALSDAVESDASWNMKDVEKRRIMEALEATHGNKTRATKLLGYALQTLYNKMKRYEIPSDYGDPRRSPSQ